MENIQVSEKAPLANTDLQNFDASLVTYEQLQKLGNFASSMDPPNQEFQQVVTTCTQKKASDDFPCIAGVSLVTVIIFILIGCFLIYFFTLPYFRGYTTKGTTTVYIISFLLLFVVVFTLGMDNVFY